MQSELEQAFARRRASSGGAPLLDVPAPAPQQSSELNELQQMMAARKSLVDHIGAQIDAAPAADETAASLDFESPVAAFEYLVASQTVADTQAAYAGLLNALSLDKPPTIARLTELLSPQLGHRGKQLLQALSTRAQSVVAVAKQPKRRAVIAVAIVGAGPVGLRTAIELAMLGTRVELLEGRDDFSRLQVLHLWDWIEADLIDLGIKFIDPSIFASTAVRRCTTMQLQHSLLKVALLCGARVRFGCRVEAEKLGQAYLKRVDVLVDASGARCPLLDSLGFSQEVALKSQRCLCIVISLLNQKTSDELQLTESTWASQYYQAEFAALQSAHGVVLENLVYYRSSGSFADAATHYFVMTTSADALRSFGALHQTAAEMDDPSAVCAAANVDLARLEAYARHAIGAFVPSLANHALCPRQLSLFDFSERKQSNRAAAVVSGSRIGSRHDTPCVVTRVGDALQEPFWPEGLGINRGFLGVFDCADLVVRATPLLIAELGRPPSTIDDFAPVLARREAIYGLTKRISATNRQKELKPFSEGARKFTYTLEPGSRYVAWSEAGGGRDGTASIAVGGGWSSRNSKAAAPAASGWQLGAGGWSSRNSKAAAPAPSTPRMRFHVNVLPSVR